MVDTAPSAFARDVAVVPSHVTKTIYLIRHAEGYHNHAGERDSRAYALEAYADARLTTRGVAQCRAFVRALRARERYDELLKRCQLVVVSPLTRAMETASEMFGVEETSANARGALSRAVKAVEGKATERKALALNAKLCEGKKFLAHELCREQIGGNPCDRRRTKTEYEEEFPGIDFSLIEHEDDIYWQPGKENREPETSVRSRAREFLDWCMKRDEDHIIVVTHSAFMCNLMVEYALGGAAPCATMVDHLHRWPANCECRPLVIIDQKNSFNHGPFYHPGGDMAEE